MRALLEQLLDPKIARILNILLKKDEELFHLTKISEDSAVPLASAFRVMKKLSSLGIVDITVVGKIKLYKLSDKKEVQQLKKWLS